MQIAKITPGAIINGQIDAGAAFKILQSSMGLTEPQARAFVESQRIAQDPKAQATIKAGIISSEAESRMKFLESEGYGSILSGITRPVHVAMHDAQASMARSIGHGLETVDSMTDSLMKVMNSRYIKDEDLLNMGKVQSGTMDTTITQENLIFVQ